MKRRRRARLSLVLALSAWSAGRSEIAAADGPAPIEASVHFRHGVELYNEANYSAALVEFRKAHALAPSAAAVYDIGETQFQLQDYAGALKTFRQFLATFGVDASHYADVQASIEVLRSRVGLMRVATVPAGADVTVDDEEVGRTPLEAPILVSVGRRKVVASKAGRSTIVRYVDVAADDDVTATVVHPLESGASSPESSPSGDHASRKAPAVSSKTARNVGWAVTGALGLAAGVFGGLAVAESTSLQDERNKYPASPSAVRHDASVITAYAIAADTLALGAIAAGGVSLYFTVSAAREASSTPGARLDVSPGWVSLRATF
jgi:tetratricopeptide (TPR) repeat protein